MNYFLAILLISASAVHLLLAELQCAHFTGEIHCSNKSRIAGTVVYLYDEDCDWEMLREWNDDDFVSMFLYTSENDERFQLTGCADDLNFMGIRNSPEFFVKVKHFCGGSNEMISYYPRKMQIFLPEYNTYFTENPINLDPRRH